MKGGYFPFYTFFGMFGPQAYSRRRKHTEEKAKIVAAVWGTEFIKSFAALAVLH